TRLSILDPDDGKYIRAAREFHDWKKASFDSTLDARPGWIGKNELWYIKQSRWVFVDDYIALIRFVVLPQSRPDHGDLRERERERIESSMWLLHVLLGHYHRVPLFKDESDAMAVMLPEEVEGGETHRQPTTAETSVHRQSVDHSRPLIGGSIEGWGVDETKIATVLYNNTTSSTSDSQK